MWSRKSPDELVGHQRHRAVPRPSVATVVLEAKGDATVIEGDQPAVRDGNAVSVAGEVGKHRLGPGEGRFGVDEPVLSFEWREERSKRLPTSQTFELAKERQPARSVGVGEPGQKEPPEQAGEHPHRQEEAGSAVHPARAVMRYP